MLLLNEDPNRKTCIHVEEQSQKWLMDCKQREQHQVHRHCHHHDHQWRSCHGRQEQTALYHCPVN